MKNDSLETFVSLRRQLAQERDSLISRIRSINEVLGQIDNLKGPVESAPPAPQSRGGKRTMSPEARARIAAAQKARWAAQRGEPKPTAEAPSGAASRPKRKMSAAGRKAIAEAARRRWAKAKAAGKSRL